MATQRQIERRKRALERREADIHYWRAESLRWNNAAIGAKDPDAKRGAIALRDSANSRVQFATEECRALRRKLGSDFVYSDAKPSVSP